MENHVKYQAAAYAHTEDTLYVNLYMPTTVNWDEKNITVKQEHAILTKPVGVARRTFPQTVEKPVEKSVRRGGHPAKNGRISGHPAFCNRRKHS